MKYILTDDCEIVVYDENADEIHKPIILYYPNKIIKQADTIEELITDGDMLYIHDLYPDTVLVVEGNIKPFGYQKAIKLKDWLKYKNKFDLYIKQRNGDYKLVAKKKSLEGELELI